MLTVFFDRAGGLALLSKCLRRMRVCCRATISQCFAHQPMQQIDRLSGRTINFEMRDQISVVV